MLHSLQAQDYIQLPPLGEAGTLTLIDELEAAANASDWLPEGVTVALGLLVVAGVDRQNAIALRERAGSAAGPRARAADRALDDAWGCFQSWLLGWTRLPETAHPLIADVRAIYAALFPKGLQFLTLEFKDEWNESQQGASGGGGGGGGDDTTPPEVRIVSPSAGSSVPGNANVTIVVDATDHQVATDVMLVWQFSGATFACDAAYAGVTCSHVGSRYTWTILIGSGSRSFYAYARDAAGNTAATFEATSATVPPVENPPVVTVHLPGDGPTIARGAELIFQADVRGARAISDVRAVWTYPGGSLEYPMAVTTTPGVYQARATVTVTATAQSGWRGVEIQPGNSRWRVGPGRRYSRETTEQRTNLVANARGRRPNA